MKQILIVSPAEELLGALKQGLGRVGYQGQAVILRTYPSEEQLGKLLRSRKISTAIIDLSQPERAMQLIHGLHVSHPGVVVAAAHTANAADLILAAVRAGAAEYLGPPFECSELERVLTREASAGGRAKVAGRLFGFLPAVGGCGASTSALHVAASIAQELSQKVLLVDFDFHSSAVNLRLQIKPDFTLADAISRVDCLDELWDQLTCRWKKIHVLPAPPHDIRLKPEELARAASVFASALRTYEWVIVDLPAGIFSSCQVVLEQAEALYIVSTPELASLHHARRKVEQLRALGIPPGSIRLVVNRLDGRLSTQETEELVGVKVTHALANDYSAVNSAYMKASLVAEKSPLATQFRDFARAVMGVSKPAGRTAAASGWKGAVSRLGGLSLSPEVDNGRPPAVRGGRWLSRALVS